MYKVKGNQEKGRVCRDENKNWLKLHKLKNRRIAHHQYYQLTKQGQRPSASE